MNEVANLLDDRSWGKENMLALAVGLQITPKAPKAKDASSCLMEWLYDGGMVNDNNNSNKFQNVLEKTLKSKSQLY